MAATHGLRSWLVPVAAALGGAIGGLALAALGLVLLGSPTTIDLAAGVGEPLGAGTELVAVSGDVREGGPAEPAEIVIDVGGAVVRPGLHRLRAGARVGDAIEAAGGYGPRADLAAASQSLNLALPLEDGAKVLVPELGIARRAAAVDDARIDLNRADQAELETLPGIGPVTARKIIESRQERRFGAVRDLRTRSLVGQSVFDDLEGLVHAG